MRGQPCESCGPWIVLGILLISSYFVYLTIVLRFLCARSVRSWADRNGCRIVSMEPVRRPAPIEPLRFRPCYVFRVSLVESDVPKSCWIASGELFAGLVYSDRIFVLCED